MKALFWTFLAIFALCISTSCENRSINQRTGIYIGEAKVKETKRVFNGSQTTESVLFNGTVEDTFKIEVIDVEEKTYRIERSNWAKINSSYDIGNPYYEYILDDDFFWGYSYTYDKEWVSRLDISDADELVGYMLERDIFGSEGPDSQGNIITVHRTFEYRITAKRDK